MKFVQCITFCLLTLLLANCQMVRFSARPHTAQIVYEGWLDCFESNQPGGQPWCEASAILVQKNRTYFASDKDMPAPRSSVFSINGLLSNKVSGQRTTTVYSEQPLLRTVHKIEEFASSPNQQWVFLIAAFDRIRLGYPDLNGYNMLLAWQPGHEDSPQVVGANGNAGVSLTLRGQLQKALGNPAYFKVEGLAATSNRLWFGVCEQGESADKFESRITILAAPYHTEAGTKTSLVPNQTQLLLGPITFRREFNVANLEATLPKPLAISSLEFDPKRRCFWVLTSYQQGEKMGAYLWTISENDLLAKGNLQLVRTPDGKPLQFTHKAEDMTFADPNTLYIIHDDDQIETRIGNQLRKPNQAAYSVVKIIERKSD